MVLAPKKRLKTGGIRGIQGLPLLGTRNPFESTMNLSLQSAFLAEMSTLLILLAGAILLYSSFREKYLVPWIAGWSVFTVSKVFLALSASQPLALMWAALAYGTYVVSVGLFAASVFFYVSHQK